MLGALLGGLVDKEKAIKEALEYTIEDVSEELNLKPDEIFIMIKPISKESNDFKIYLYDVSNGGPKLVRQMKLNEFVESE